MLENFKKNRKNFKIVRFSKKEINNIMEIYSKKISIGEWKDYSIQFEKNFAMFAIHKSHAHFPEYKILKFSFKQDNYILLRKNSIVLKSAFLKNLLSYLRKPNLKLIK